MEATQALDFDQDQPDDDEDAAGVDADEAVAVLRYQQEARTFIVRRGENSIGRDPDHCRIVLDNKSLSRIHAVIEVDGNDGSAMVHDNHSLNSTWIGNRKLKPGVRYALDGGETLKLGDVSLVYEKAPPLPEPEVAEAGDDTEVIEDGIVIDEDLFVPETPVAGMMRNGGGEHGKALMVAETPGGVFEPKSQSSPYPAPLNRQRGNNPQDVQSTRLEYSSNMEKSSILTTTDDNRDGDETAEEGSFLAPTQQFPKPLPPKAKAGSKMPECLQDMDTQQMASHGKGGDSLLGATSMTDSALFSASTQQFPKPLPPKAKAASKMPECSLQDMDTQQMAGSGNGADSLLGATSMTDSALFGASTQQIPAACPQKSNEEAPTGVSVTLDEANSLIEQDTVAIIAAPDEAGENAKAVGDEEETLEEAQEAAAAAADISSMQTQIMDHDDSEDLLGEGVGRSDCKGDETAATVILETETQDNLSKTVQSHNEEPEEEEDQEYEEQYQCATQLLNLSSATASDSKNKSSSSEDTVIPSSQPSQDNRASGHIFKEIMSFSQASTMSGSRASTSSTIDAKQRIKKAQVGDHDDDDLGCTLMVADSDEDGENLLASTQVLMMDIKYEKSKKKPPQQAAPDGSCGPSRRSMVVQNPLSSSSSPSMSSGMGKAEQKAAIATSGSLEDKDACDPSLLVSDPVVFDEFVPKVDVNYSSFALRTCKGDPELKRRKQKSAQLGLPKKSLVAGGSLGRRGSPSVGGSPSSSLATFKAVGSDRVLPDETDVDVELPDISVDTSAVAKGSSSPVASPVPPDPDRSAETPGTEGAKDRAQQLQVPEPDERDPTPSSDATLVSPIRRSRRQPRPSVKLSDVDFVSSSPNKRPKLDSVANNSPSSALAVVVQSEPEAAAGTGGSRSSQASKAAKKVPLSQCQQQPGPPPKAVLNSSRGNRKRATESAWICEEGPKLEAPSQRRASPDVPTLGAKPSSPPQVDRKEPDSDPLYLSHVVGEPDAGPANPRRNKGALRTIAPVRMPPRKTDAKGSVAATPAVGQGIESSRPDQASPTISAAASNVKDEAPVRKLEIEAEEVEPREDRGSRGDPEPARASLRNRSVARKAPLVEDDGKGEENPDQGKLASGRRFRLAGAKKVQGDGAQPCKDSIEKPSVSRKSPRKRSLEGSPEPEAKQLRKGPSLLGQDGPAAANPKVVQKTTADAATTRGAAAAPTASNPQVQCQQPAEGRRSSQRNRKPLLVPPPLSAVVEPNGLAPEVTTDKAAVQDGHKLLEKPAATRKATLKENVKHGYENKASVDPDDSLQRERFSSRRTSRVVALIKTATDEKSPASRRSDKVEEPSCTLQEVAGSRPKRTIKKTEKILSMEEATAKTSSSSSLLPGPSSVTASSKRTTRSLAPAMKAEVKETTKAPESRRRTVNATPERASRVQTAPDRGGPSIETEEGSLSSATMNTRSLRQRKVATVVAAASAQKHEQPVTKTRTSGRRQAPIGSIPEAAAEVKSEDPQVDDSKLKKTSRNRRRATFAGTVQEQAVVEQANQVKKAKVADENSLSTSIPCLATEKLAVDLSDSLECQQQRRGSSGGGGAAAAVVVERSDSVVSRTIKQISDNSSRESSPLRRKSKPAVMFTGYEDKQDAKAVRELGGTVTSESTACTVLVTDKVRRTAKLLCAMGRGVPIVPPAWISLSKQEKTFLDPWQHLIDDAESEKRFGFILRTSLTAASKSPLFKGYKIHATRSCSPPPNQLKEIVESAGGVWLDQLPKESADDIIIISCKQDKSIYSRALRSGFNVQDKEVLLTGLLRHFIDFKAYRLSD